MKTIYRKTCPVNLSQVSNLTFDPSSRSSWITLIMPDSFLITLLLVLWLGNTKKKSYIKSCPANLWPGFENKVATMSHV